MLKILFEAIILIVSIKGRYIGAKLTLEGVLVHAVDGGLAVQLRRVVFTNGYIVFFFVNRASSNSGSNSLSET